MKTAYIACVVTVICTVGIALHAAPLASVSAQRADQPPGLDGRFDDAVWKSAKWQEGFSELGTGKPAEP